VGTLLAVDGDAAGLGVLSISGFHYSANQLAARLTESLWFVLSVLLVRSLLARWLFIRQWKLARRLAEERAAEASAAEASAAEAESPAEGEDAEENLADRAREAKRKEQEQTLVRIDQQLQKLLRLGVTTALLVGSVDDLERHVARVAGAGPHSGLAAEQRGPDERAATRRKPRNLRGNADRRGTGGLVARAGEPVADRRHLAGRFAADAADRFSDHRRRKEPAGLLEVTLLERLPLDRGARNAVTTLSGYAIMLAGLLMGANAIGLRWQNIQWLAAALTVGLGFGLQEIFANFVSGLILLFERPIRVGDIITLGDVDGTVTKIRIRATTITTWDRKELIVPNKELITGRLLNWTLSDQINRLVVEVGVAYGSNVAKVRRLMLRIANDHPVVLKDPGPVVTFESFGDSALNFVLRCYLPSLENRLATIHDLHAAIHDRFAREGIEIAFPQLDLHVRSAPPGCCLGEARRAAAVQFQHAPGDKSTNLGVIRDFVEQAAERQVQLICFPECCISGYWHLRHLTRDQMVGLAEPVFDGPASRQLMDLAQRHRMTIGAGLIEIGADGGLYNTYAVAMPDGRFARHRKLHVFVSEYLSPGDAYTVFDTPHGWRVGC
jgi:potassium-dependent mechanosensitive channel